MFGTDGLEEEIRAMGAAIGKSGVSNSGEIRRTPLLVRVIVLYIPLVAITAGCGPSAADRLVGRWKGSVQIDQAEADRQLEAKTSPLEKGMGRFLLSGLKSMKMTMEFQSDGQMTMSLAAGPLNRESRATWKVVHGDAEKVTISSVDEKGNEQQFALVFEGPDTFVMESLQDSEMARLGKFRFVRVVE